MPNPLHYKKAATVYVRRDSLKKSSGNSVIYDILDALEKIARVIAAINRWLMGDPRTASGKRRLRRIKKYAKINKRTGMLILKKGKRLTALKPSRAAKRWVPQKNWSIL